MNKERTSSSKALCDLEEATGRSGSRVGQTAIESYIRARRAAAKSVTLDLGCGMRKVCGAFGIDGCALSGVDVVHDLRVTPYPVPDSCADEIHLNHVLEHFADPLLVMEEVWRIARPKALVCIRTPHYSGEYAWIDPTHRRAFTSRSFHYFGDNEYSYYTKSRFRVVRVRLKYFLDENCWPIRYRLWGRLVQRFLDAHPTFSERFLCYLVGGIDEIQVTLEAQKPVADPSFPETPARDG